MLRCPGQRGQQSGVQYTAAYGLPWVLDIVEPDTDVVLPLAVVVHGGGFKGGARISNEVGTAVLAASRFAAAPSQ